MQKCPVSCACHAKRRSRLQNAPDGMKSEHKKRAQQGSTLHLFWSEVFPNDLAICKCLGADAMENQGSNCELPGGIQEPQEPQDLQQDLVEDAPRRRNEQRRRLRTRQSSAAFEATRCSQLSQPVLSCSSRRPEDSTVMLRIYDVMGAEVVSGLNCLCRVIGTGAFHAGVEVYGLEWSFGFSEDGSGVFSCTPGECGGHAYREAVWMGDTPLGEEDVMILLSTLAQDWQGSDYDILRRNCCHFSDALCRQLQVGHIPGWVTNLAGAGAKVATGLHWRWVIRLCRTVRVLVEDLGLIRTQEDPFKGLQT
eukprot:s1720_g18.t1